MAQIKVTSPVVMSQPIEAVPTKPKRKVQPIKRAEVIGIAAHIQLPTLLDSEIATRQARFEKERLAKLKRREEMRAAESTFKVKTGLAEVGYKIKLAETFRATVSRELCSCHDRLLCPRLTG